MIEGIDELLQKLGDIGEIAPELESVLDACGVFVRDDARLRVPVDTGDLRKSIQHTTRRIHGGILTTVHTNSDHAVFVELGTGPAGAADHEGISPHITPVYKKEKWRGVIPGLKSDKDSGIRYIAGQRAQPYLYPALKENEDQINRYIMDEIRKRVRQKIHG